MAFGTSSFNRRISEWARLEAGFDLERSAIGRETQNELFFGHSREPQFNGAVLQVEIQSAYLKVK